VARPFFAPNDFLILMCIVRARPEDAKRLTDIAFAAKRHWRYPERWMESWRDLLTILPEFITNHETHAALLDQRMVGFYALGVAGRKMDLQHLWVLPEVMGQGIGRSLFMHALQRAHECGCREVEIESDPNSEGFYQRMGARRVGINAIELDGQRRELPILIYEMTNA
jgi:ribosomal protein S18 acetylase RimI-like enzyme